MDTISDAISISEEDLIGAIKSQDHLKIKTILKSNDIRINYQDGSGHTPLGIAASTGFMRGAEALLSAGSLINEADFYEQIPLQYAANNGHLDMLQLLIEKGSDVNWNGGSISSGLSAIYLATLNRHTEIVEHLIDAKCDVNTMDINGVSVLHCAVGNGHQDIVEHLLRAKARVNIRGVNSGRTPLFVAAEVGNLEILNMLIKAGARVNIPNDYDMTPLCAVCLRNNTQVALRLLQAGAGSKVNFPDNTGSIALHYAARFGNIQVMKDLIDKGSELNLFNDDKMSPLDKAVANYQIDAVDLLIKHGSDVNLHDPHGSATTLHVAVDTSYKPDDFSKLLEILIEGGYVLHESRQFPTDAPLARALVLEKVKFAKILLQHGSNPNTDCPFDITVFQKACEKRWIDLIDLLLHCDLDWSRETWLDTDIHSSGINPKLLTGYVKHVPTVLIRHVDLYRKILQVRGNPRRLLDICRLTARHHIGNKLHVKIEETQLPSRLKRMVMLKIL